MRQANCIFKNVPIDSEEPVSVCDYFPNASSI